ncbi:MAG: zinc-binding metallopeptidase family protein [Victivallaceae bacterium]
MRRKSKHYKNISIIRDAGNTADIILDELRSKKETWLAGIQSVREMILGNVAMLADFPAPTFNESDRAKFILSRLSESGSKQACIDDICNVIAAEKGRAGKKNILVCAHIDNQFEEGVDQRIAVTESKVYGAGIADDNLSIAVLMALPDILRKLNVRLDCNLTMLFASRFHGKGDFEGMRMFIEKHPRQFDTVINLNGLTLGTLKFFTLSRTFCEIHCKAQDAARKNFWLKMIDGNAILVINEVISSLFSIPLPSKPRTALNIGKVLGGEHYSSGSREAMISLEIFCEDENFMDLLLEEIKHRCHDISVKNYADIKVEFFGRHRASGLSCGHPLIKTALGIVNEIGRTPQLEYATSHITVCLSEKIPSLSIGLTDGVGGNTADSYIEIAPLTHGILQLVMLLKSIDMMGDSINAKY